MRNPFAVLVIAAALATACGGNTSGPSPIVSPTPAPVRIVVQSIGSFGGTHGVGQDIFLHPSRVGINPGDLDVWVEYDPKTSKVFLFLHPGPSDWKLCYWNPDHPDCIAATLARDVSDNLRKQIKHPLEPGAQVYLFIRFWEGEVTSGRGEVGFTPFP